MQTKYKKVSNQQLEIDDNQAWKCFLLGMFNQFDKIVLVKQKPSRFNQVWNVTGFKKETTN